MIQKLLKTLRDKEYYSSLTSFSDEKTYTTVADGLQAAV